LRKPLVIAHRGFSGKFPENTHLAFLEAIAIEGCDGFEVDVHLSADSEPVIIHDYALERTTNGKGLVNALKFNELRQLDIGSWMNSKFTDERIMHLDELLELAIRHNKVLNIELKNYEQNYLGMEEVIINRINAMNAADCVFLSSFNHISMGLIKRIDASIRTGFLYAQPLLEAEKYAAYHGIDALHPQYNLLCLEQNLVERAHKIGLSVHTWTVNSEADMGRFINLGVDSIITDYPDRLVEVLGQRNTL